MGTVSSRYEELSTGALVLPMKPPNPLVLMRVPGSGRLKGPGTSAKCCELSTALCNMKNIKDLKKKKHNLLNRI